MSSKTVLAVLPPVIVYVATNPGAPTRKTAVAPYLNLGLTAAEAAGAEAQVHKDEGWNWGTKTAAGLALFFIVLSFLVPKLVPGGWDALPAWVFIGLFFVLIPGFALPGMIMANISGRRYLRWLKKAQEIATSHGHKILYCGDLSAEDQESVCLLLTRIESARQRLLEASGGPLPAEAEARLLAALSTLGDFLVMPALEPLPAMLGMLDSDVQALTARHRAAEAAIHVAFESVIAKIEDLESLPAVLSANSGGLVAGPRVPLLLQRSGNIGGVQPRENVEDA